MTTESGVTRWDKEFALLFVVFMVQGLTRVMVCVRETLLGNGFCNCNMKFNCINIIMECIYLIDNIYLSYSFIQLISICILFPIAIYINFNQFQFIIDINYKDFLELDFKRRYSLFIFCRCFNWRK